MKFFCIFLKLDLLKISDIRQQEARFIVCISYVLHCSICSIEDPVFDPIFMQEELNDPTRYSGWPKEDAEYLPSVLKIMGQWVDDYIEVRLICLLPCW